MNSGLLSLIGGAIGLFIIGVIINNLKQMGRLEQQVSDQKAEIEITKKQGEIMAESRDSEDAAVRLDNGSF